MDQRDIQADQEAFRAEPVSTSYKTEVEQEVIRRKAETTYLEAQIKGEAVSMKT